MFHNACRKSIAALATIVVAFFTFTGAVRAAVEVNGADPSQLESIKGIGPALSGKIMDARKQGNFKDWSDFQTRVSGVGEKNAAGFSRAGLTVAGRPKDGAQASVDAADKGTAKNAPRRSSADAGSTAVASSARK